MTQSPVSQTSVLSACQDSLYLLTTVIVALSLGWLVCALFNFSYGTWHDLGGIGDAIERFGSENRYREGFHLTTKGERADLFAQINYSIHYDGEGLAGITYQVADLPEQALLRKPEVIHLQDVAHLVTVGKFLAGIALLMWLSGMGLIYTNRYQVPPARRQAIILGCCSLLVIALVLVVGPIEIFYWMHEWAFPDGHQWFFYYQESLMSTMMYAPYLFGYIAIQWFIVATIVFCLLHRIAVGMKIKGMKTRGIKRRT